MKHRCGKFYVSENLIKDYPDEVAKVLAFIKFVPLRVEFDYSTMKFQYNGLSEKFDEIEKGELIPEYRLHVGYNINGDEKNLVDVYANREN